MTHPKNAYILRVSHWKLRTVINYTNFGLNGKNCNNCIKQHSADCPNSRCAIPKLHYLILCQRRTEKINKKIITKTIDKLILLW